MSEHLLSLPELLHALVPVVSTTVNVLSQLVCVRYLGVSYYRSVVIGFVLGCALTCVAECLYFYRDGVESIPLAFFNIANYCLLGFGYFSFINIGKTALRVRMLTEMKNSQDGLTLAEILAIYNARDIVDIRVDRLVRNGQLAREDGRFYSKMSITLAIAITIDLFKLVVFGKDARMTAPDRPQE